MKTIIDTFIKRPIFASMVILAMVVVGAAAFGNLGVDRLPAVDMPTVSVRTTLPGAAPEEVETQVTKIIEEAVNTVEGIDELRSISNPGSSMVIASFRLDRDIDVAAQDIRDKVAVILGRLPRDVDPPRISKFDSDSSPVITLALHGPRSLRELSEIADKIAKPLLERSKGVGELQLVGTANRTINVYADADKLAAQRLSITEVRDAIVRENSEQPGGNLTGESGEKSVRTQGRLKSADEFGSVIIRRNERATVRVQDVARVEDGTAEQRSSARLNGAPSVSIEIRRQSGTNSVAVIEAVKANLDAVRAQLPPDVQLDVIRDQSNYIYAALHEIEIHLILGSILACSVVLLFTRSWRSMVIAGVAIPASVITTFAMMWLLDFTLNSVTMLALVLMVGIVIDDAIVVLENIFRFVEEKKLTPMEAARQGTREIATAVLATTLSLAVIFLPVSFMSSITGRFLYQFGITAAVAVLVSLIVSIVLTPTLSARLLKPHSKSRNSREGFYRHIDSSYTWMLKLAMRGRWIVTIVALGIISSSVYLFSITPQSYLPDGIDEGEFELRANGPEGMNFQDIDQLMRSVEADLRAMPEVRTVLITTGGGGWSSATNQGAAHIEIAPHSERKWSFSRQWKSLLKGEPLAAFRGNYSQSDVMVKTRNAMRKYRDMRMSVRNYPSFNLGGGNFDIDFSVSGPDIQTLAKLTAELAQRGREMGGIEGLDTTLKLDKPELQVKIDRERANDLGVSVEDIGTALRLMIGGDEEISDFHDDSTNEDYDVRLRLDERFRSDDAQVSRLLLSASDGRLIELQNLAEVSEAIASSRIDRLDRARDARVRGTLGPGYALADVNARLLEQARQMNMPPGYNVSVRGAGREFERTSSEFVYAFSLSVIFMYMILASQYENLIHPLVILLSLPLSVPFALLSIWLAGGSLNLYSALGLLVLFGVVKKNAILQIDHMNQLRDRGVPSAQAILDGNRDRLRPILMTTLTLVAGMLPLWIGTGPGAEERRAVATVVIGGQSLALLITLLMTPVAYSIFDDLGARVTKRKVKEESIPIATPIEAK